MRLIHILYASWTLVAAFEARQESSATDISSHTRSEHSPRTTLSTTTTSEETSATSITSPTPTDSAPDSSSDFGTYNGPSDSDASSGSAINADAGASGSSSGSFNLSKGGIIAICVVVSFVVIFGVASTVLFIIAKRRQWNVRASIRRASRRLTGRGAPAPSRTAQQSRRTGIQMTSTPATRGHKRGLIVEVQDVEKGKAQQPNSEASSAWTQKLKGNGWKR